MRRLKHLTYTLYVVGMLILALALYTSYHHTQPNGCDMTYMWPNYHIISQPNHSRYHLYRYTEGKSKHDILHPSGMPLLFIHGNAGSYKQVRSIGSELARMYSKELLDTYNDEHIGSFKPVVEQIEASNEFDVYTVDLNEEFSGLSGPLLAEQAAYTRQCIEAILELYTNEINSVIVVAHSMGGIIARLLPSNVRTIITLSTPHLQPIANVDETMNELYQSVNSTALTVSINGGYRDELIPPWITDSKSVMAVSTRSIPDVWLEADHQCIVWCNQVVKVICRCLFGLLDNNGYEIVSYKQRERVFREILFGDFNGEKFEEELLPSRIITKDSLKLDQIRLKHLEWSVKNGIDIMSRGEIARSMRVLHNNVEAGVIRFPNTRVGLDVNRWSNGSNSRINDDGLYLWRINGSGRVNVLFGKTGPGYFYATQNQDNQMIDNGVLVSCVDGVVWARCGGQVLFGNSLLFDCDEDYIELTVVGQKKVTVSIDWLMSLVKYFRKSVTQIPSQMGALLLLALALSKYTDDSIVIVWWLVLPISPSLVHLWSGAIIHALMFVLRIFKNKKDNGKLRKAFTTTAGVSIAARVMHPFVLPALGTLGGLWTSGSSNAILLYLVACLSAVPSFLAWATSKAAITRPDIWWYIAICVAGIAEVPTIKPHTMTALASLIGAALLMLNVDLIFMLVPVTAIVAVSRVLFDFVLPIFKK